MNNKKQIVLCGTHSTGKTTILNHYKDLGWNCITEVVRDLAKKGVNINEDGDVEGQRTIFNEYKKKLNRKTGFISDRSLIDVLGYTTALYSTGKIDENFVNKQYIYTYKFFSEHPDIIICYVPIEFPVEDDNVRSTDESFRSSVDFFIKNFLDSSGLPYHTISGSLEERIKQIDELIK